VSFSSSFDPRVTRELLERSARSSSSAVLAAAQRSAPALEDAAALLSPAAGDLLEDLAAQAHRATIARFGNTMGLYAPLYLSNECVCTCTYCGFSMGLPIARRTLRPDEVMREARTLVERGIRNILLVSAEHPKHVNAEYVALCVREVKLAVPYVGLEIAAADEDDYRRYVEAGCDGVVLYQETYDPQAYATYHLGGPKKKYAWRLDAPERASRAGVQHLGIGALLGLAEWRFEALALVQHARWLARHSWRSQINVSLPRINHAEGGFEPAHRVSDRDFVHFLLFLRLTLPEAGITLSTRETPQLRDRLAPLGVTQMSAGSSTEPGGYGEPGAAGEQFELEDHRSPSEVAQRLRELGYDPVFKDWDQSIAPRRPASQSSFERAAAGE
jgi:2-iminoacetate synthase